jgi:hypothetical protein
MQIFTHIGAPFGIGRDGNRRAAGAFLPLSEEATHTELNCSPEGLGAAATPDELRGRVTAVESVFIGASNELGMFVAGSGGALLGPVAAVLVGGSMTLLITLSWAGLFPPLRRLDRFTELT